MERDTTEQHKTLLGSWMAAEMSETAWAKSPHYKGITVKTDLICSRGRQSAVAALRSHEDEDRGAEICQIIPWLI